LIFDVDDFNEQNHRLDLLGELKAANPAFRVTAFAVPAYCPPSFVSSLPDWIELVPHGWFHGGPTCPDPYEAANWTYEEAIDVMLAMPDGFVDGWKSPGWQISYGTYQALEELDWWIADQHANDDRRPPSLRVHCEGDGDHVHCHVQNVCGNGLQETWASVLPLVEAAESFELISEVVAPMVTA
jgi:hypothetical protein